MTRLLIVIGFIVWFSAGLAVGWRVGHTPVKPPEEHRRGDRGSWLVQQLGLTAEQQKQMSEIWSVIGQGGREGASQRAQIRREREEAIAALIPEERQEAMEEIQKQYTGKLEAMENQWKQSYQQAVEKTRAILTPEQRGKYDALQLRHENEGPRDRGRPPRRPSEMQAPPPNP